MFQLIDSFNCSIALTNIDKSWNLKKKQQLFFCTFGTYYKMRYKMIQDFHRMISAALGISERQISQTLGLLEDGATIPFISRYRKEATGGLDEVQIEAIQTQYEKLSETAKRKETILNTIQEQGKLTAELQKRIEETWDNTLLEDIYLPYKPKRKTRPVRF